MMVDGESGDCLFTPGEWTVLLNAGIWEVLCLAGRCCDKYCLQVRCNSCSGALYLYFHQFLFHVLCQVVLHWGIQRGYSVIPKSENEDRMLANLKVEGFSLTEEDMESINSLERGLRLNDPGHFCPLAFGSECPIWD